MQGLDGGHAREYGAPDRHRSPRHRRHRLRTHATSSSPSLQIGDVLLMQPKNWGISLGRMDFVLQPKETSGWKIVSKSSRLIPVTRDTAADAKVLEIGRPYHELAERYLSTAVAEAPVSLDSQAGSRGGLGAHRCHPASPALLLEGRRLVRVVVQLARQRAAGPGDHSPDRGAVRLRESALRGRGRRQDGARRAGELSFSRCIWPDSGNSPAC